jgi:hypothetical protein
LVKKLGHLSWIRLNQYVVSSAFGFAISLPVETREGEFTKMDLNISRVVQGASRALNGLRADLPKSMVQAADHPGVLGADKAVFSAASKARNSSPILDFPLKVRRGDVTLETVKGEGEILKCTPDEIEVAFEVKQSFWIVTAEAQGHFKFINNPEVEGEMTCTWKVVGSNLPKSLPLEGIAVRYKKLSGTSNEAVFTPIDETHLPNVRISKHGDETRVRMEGLDLEGDNKEPIDITFFQG